MRATQGTELEATSRAMAATTGETSAQASNDINQQIATIQLAPQEAVMAIKAIAQSIGEVRPIASAIAEAVEERVLFLLKPTLDVSPMLAVFGHVHLAA